MVNLLVLATLLVSPTAPAQALQAVRPQKPLYGDFHTTRSYPINWADPSGLLVPAAAAAAAATGITIDLNPVIAAAGAAAAWRYATQCPVQDVLSSRTTERQAELAMRSLIRQTEGFFAQLAPDEPVSGTPALSTAGGGSRKPPRVIQTGGNTLRSGTARTLNATFGVNLTRREWGRILEALKKENLLPPSFHQTQILENGDVVSTVTGEVIDNLRGYVP